MTKTTIAIGTQVIIKSAKNTYGAYFVKEPVTVKDLMGNGDIEVTYPSGYPSSQIVANGDFKVFKPKPKKAPKPKAANTKIAKLRSHFLSGRSLTQLEAIGLYGAFRLAARVHELKGDGMKIITRMKEDPNGNPYAEYQLRSPWVKG